MFNVTRETPVYEMYVCKDLMLLDVLRERLRPPSNPEPAGVRYVNLTMN